MSRTLSPPGTIVGRTAGHVATACPLLGGLQERERMREGDGRERRGENKMRSRRTNTWTSGSSRDIKDNSKPESKAATDSRQ